MSDLTRVELMARQMGALLKCYAPGDVSGHDKIDVVAAFREGFDGGYPEMAAHLELPMLRTEATVEAAALADGAFVAETPQAIHVTIANRELLLMVGSKQPGERDYHQLNHPGLWASFSSCGRFLDIRLFGPHGEEFRKKMPLP